MGIFGENAGRRKYRIGRSCQDCGWNKRTTLIHFWASNMPYYVCSECIRPYRTMIMHPDPEWKRK